MSEDVTALLKAGESHTVYSLVTEMGCAVENFEEIYAVVKMKDGRWLVLETGTNMGLAFGIAILQDHLSEHLRD